MTARARLVLAAGIAAFGAVPLSNRILHPFVTAADNNTAAFAQPARNFLRHGLIATRLGLATDPAGETPKQFTYLAHHPPLFALGASAAFLLLGVSDWAARIYPAACSLGSALLLFALWRRHRGDGPAALAAVVMATLPAYGHFGKMLGEEAPTLLFGLLTIFLYGTWKEASPQRAARLLAGCLAAYAAGCFSGWAAFHVGPILMLDALLTLRHRRTMLLSGLLGIGLTGVAVFSLIMGHFALLTGSLQDIVGAAAHRSVESASGIQFKQGWAHPWLQWLKGEAGFFADMYGVEAAALALAGALSGVVALARRRARADAVRTVLIVAASGAAHPLLFPWAAYLHNWLLFHLLAIMAIAAAEGILFAAGLVAAGVRAAGAPKPASAAAAVLAGAILLGHRTVVCARGLEALASDDPRCAWPLLGQEIGRRAPPGTRLMTNFRISSHPLIFYIDRPHRTVLTLSSFQDRLPQGGFTLYVRDMNIPLDPDFEERLSEYPSVDVASYRIYDMRAPPGSEPVDGAAAGPQRATRRFGGPLEADFAGVVSLTGFEVEIPAEKPRPLPFVRSFFGSGGGSMTPDRVIRMTSFWSALKSDLPHWRVFASISRKQPDGTYRGLPLAYIQEEKHPLISRWKDRDYFRIESAFVFVDGLPAADYEVRLALYDGSRPVTPLLPGPPRPGLKSVVAGTIPLFTDADWGSGGG